MVSAVLKNALRACSSCFVQLMSSADEADRGHAVAVVPQSVDGRLLHLWMIRQSEIIVRTKVEDFSLRHSNLAALGT